MVTHERVVSKVRCAGINHRREVGAIIDNRGEVLTKRVGRQHDIVLVDHDTIKAMRQGGKQGRKYSVYHYHGHDDPLSLDDIRIGYLMKERSLPVERHTVVTNRREISYAPGPGGMKAYQRLRRGRSRQITRNVDQYVHARGVPSRRMIMGIIDRANRDNIRRVGGTYHSHSIPARPCRRR